MASGTIVADERVVAFKGADASTIAALVRDAGGELVPSSSTHMTSGYAVVRFPSAAAAELGQARLAESEHVADVAPNHIMVGMDTAEGTGLGTSPSLPLPDIGRLQWNLYVMGLDPFGTRPLAQNVKVAVLDTGVAFEEWADDLGTYAQAPSLAGVQFAAGYDFVNDDDHANDDQRHGTHVTSVITAMNGLAGVSAGMTIIPVKVLDAANRGTELALAEGIRYAVDQGAQVINLSLAFPTTYFPSQFLQSAIDYATLRGVVIVAASGNHGEPVVAYPAAFRDVIAVGASDVGSIDMHGQQSPAWGGHVGELVRADYSDHSYKIDVVAPGGSIPGDADGDGLPEAILGETFKVGDPTDFNYYFYAGTSQAAAEVSAVVAAMKAVNPSLDPYAVRALLGQTALPLDEAAQAGVALSPATGRGAIRADAAIAAAANPIPVWPRVLSSVNLSLHTAGNDVVARVRVEIIDEAGAPVPNATVYGTFTGAAAGTVKMTTDDAGVAIKFSTPLVGDPVVAFQVDAVTWVTPSGVAFDRPRGFSRIDSASLEMLMTFAQGLTTSPSVEGSGLSTSPSVTIATPVLEVGVVPSLTLANFGWSLATVPMAATAAEAWYLDNVDGAAERRVVALEGSGVGEPLRFDATSFPSEVAPPVAGESVPLLVVTYASGSGLTTSPSAPLIQVDPLGVMGNLNVNVVNQLLTAWLIHGSGLTTSPSITEFNQLDPTTFNKISAVGKAYPPFASSPISAPAGSYGVTLGVAELPLAPQSAGEPVGLGVSELP